MLGTVVALAFYGALLMWSIRISRLVQAHGGPIWISRNLIGLLAVALYFALNLLPTAANPAVFHLLRVVSAMLLVVSTFITERRLRRWLADPHFRAAETFDLSPEPRPEDWNANLWDPEVQRDIERRRRRQPTD
ncbi:hypothetical protein [Micromonospora zhanjiangensis]|uniref:Uncharacterized protein n=1 Tax=Micromonospora zhanjiangensis TaxID=1522057 RepID=A0ABV8KJ77_9ACTN